MKKKYVFLISSIIVSASIVFTGVYIGNSIKEASQIEIQQEKVLLTEEEAADFLGLSLNDFQIVLSHEKKQRDEGISGIKEFQHVPFIEIRLDNYYTKSGLMRWAEYSGILRNRIR